MASLRAHQDCVGTVTALGVAADIAGRVLRQTGGSLRWDEWVAAAGAPPALPEGLLQSDTVLMGGAVENPVQLAQRVHRVDRTIPVLILTAPERMADLKRAIMFSPFLGAEVRPWPADELDELPGALLSAVERRQQRSSYRGTMDSEQLHLGRLSLFQPEITHYLDRLLDRAPIGVLSVEPGGAILSVSRRAEAILRVSERAVLGTPVAHFFAPAEQGRLAEFLARTAPRAEPAVPAVFQVAPAVREQGYVEATVTPLAYHSGQRGAMLILQDVTERVRAERERERAEQDLRSHVTVLRAFHRISSAPSLPFSARLREMLEFACRHLDLPYGLVCRQDGDAMEVIDAISPDNRVRRGDRLPRAEGYCDLTRQTADPLGIAAAAPGEAPRYGGERIEAYLGARVLVRGQVFGTVCLAGPAPRAAPFASTDRETLKLIAQWIGVEIQREQDEAQMRMLSGALEQAADSVVLTDRDGMIEYVNPAYERLTGYAKDEVIGRKTSVLRSGAQDEAFYEELWRVINGGGVFRGIFINRRKDGSVYHEDKTITPLRDAKGEITHFVSTGHDVTERARAEEAARLHQAEMAHVARLSTLGEMTSGLAHELTQPLCAITTYAQTCLRIVNSGRVDPGDLKYGLEQVVKQAELGGAIFRRLRNFARKGETVKRAVSLREVVREAVSLISAELAQNEITMKIEGAGWSPTVMVDPIQIEQVLLNLFRNGMDAMAGADPRRRRLTVRSARKGRDAVLVSISDQGRGCPPEVAERLFEPFFTTKPNGMGIGLGISQTIIEGHGGRLWLDSNSGLGATFSFTLPLVGTQSDETPAH